MTRERDHERGPRDEPRSELGLMNRLYRNPRRGMLFGVCAGLADYFGFDVSVTRVIVVVAAFFSFPIVIVAYFVLAMLLPRAPYGAPGFDEPPDPLRRQVRSSPHDTLTSVRYRFRELDGRLQRLEKYVTSSRYTLDREFKQLKE